MRILKILKLAPLVTLVLSCVRPIVPMPRAAEPDVKLVDRVFEYTNELSWRNSGYWRIDDQPGQWPWFLVITGNLGCPSWDHELKVPTRGEQYHCKSQWRIHRSY
jgi:hypothetical protein